MNRTPLFRKFTLLASTLMLWIIAFSQNGAGEEKSVMASEGKIYVVMTVVLVILLGFFVYLISLDRKISRLEKESGK
jgi:CcmD family protein